MNDPDRFTRRELEIEGGRRLYLYQFDADEKNEPSSESDEGIEPAK